MDLLLDEGSSFLLYEIKSSKTLRPEMAKALGLVVLKPAKKFVVSFHEKSMPLAGSAVTAGDHDRRRVYHAHTDFTGGYRAAENVIQKMLNVETFDIYTI
ncbi:MAG: hypothetical protein LBK13_04815 [Spirochaetales bacterium]|nr:hypothetical protein [Spirochaetales bacterium]